MKIAIGCDHAAFEMKAAIVDILKGLGHEVVNFGTDGPASVDYPDYGSKVAHAVAGGQVDRGILLCGTGLGMSIVANKVKGIRAALCSEPFSARMSRQHNDANILVMGARTIGMAMAEDITRVWLETPFDGGRHMIRLDKIGKLEV